MRKIIFVGLGLVLLAAGCNNKSQVSTQVLSGTTEIDMTSSGFIPADITVKAGTTVVFKNTDTEGHWVASNPHPLHTVLPGFDALQTIATGNTYAYTFTKVGTWGFHDHTNPSMHGSVIVTP
ncbi:MAG: cupredoxin domain-containing protein [Candidatus Doudnabacteria bacterium]